MSQLSDPMTEPNVLFLGWLWLGVFLANPGHFCGRGATLWCRNPLLSSNNYPQGHLMKIEWLVAGVTAVGSLDRTERAIWGVIVTGCIFGQFRSYLWLGMHFVM